MTPSRVVGFGAGGHAKVVLEILQLNAAYDLVGLLDADPDLAGQSVLGVAVLGDDGHLQALLDQGVDGFFVGVGSTSSATARQRLFAAGLERGLQPIAAAVHPRAIVSASAALGPGSVVMAGAIINPGARLGANVIVNTGAIIDHDCEIADHAHIAPGAHLAGGVKVGLAAHVGVGASVRQGLSIGEGAVVGAGAAVVVDVPPWVVVVGVPARLLRRLDDPIGAATRRGGPLQGD